MNEPKFTPGPWTVGKLVACQEESSNCWHTFSYQRDIFPPLGEAGPVAIVSHEDPADAHLIAAAPDLYAALDKLTKSMSECHACGAELTPDRGPSHCVDCPSGCECHEEPDCAQLRTIIAEADAALAKARGEEPKP